MSARIFVLLFAATFALNAANAQTPTSFTALEGTDVVDSAGSFAGTLRDVVVGEDGRAYQILIGHGGIFGIGQTLRAMDIDALPQIADGQIHLNLTGEEVASLPVYVEVVPTAQPERGSLPVSGANQQAPQNATTDIPVTPSAADKPAPAAAPTPAEMPRTQASADVSQSEAMPQPKAQPGPLVQDEQSAAGSGSTGMAPQQGTGTGATQASPSANEGGGRDEGAAASDPGLNAQYGREQTPANQPPTEGSAGRAAADTSAPGAGADPDQLKPAPAGTIAESEKPKWRIGKIVGMTVHGDRDGLSVKDLLFSGSAVETAVIARNGLEDISVPFNALNLGGTADEPKVALESRR